MTMTARCCNELLAELDRVAERQRARQLEGQALEQQDSAQRLASLYEAAIRSHESSTHELDDTAKGAVG
jgi:hypothetical protein